MNLAKGVVADGEGATKFISVTVSSCKTENDARKISLSIANSPLVKTAISGEDPNFGRILMAIGKADVSINLNKLNIKMGEISIIDRGEISLKYKEEIAAEYMKNKRIDIFVDTGSGSKSFTSFTMDLSKKYIDINSDYRS